MRARFLVATFLVLISGCETMAPKPATAPVAVKPAPPPPPPQPPPAPPPEPPKPVTSVKTFAEVALDEGTALYFAGDFNGTIKSLLAAKDIWNGPAPIKLSAHKYLAFSYCVTRRRTLCRAQFAEALKLDPEFALEPAEKSHPLWGPQYEAAKKAAAARPAARQSGPPPPAVPAQTSPLPPKVVPVPSK
ncbi:MAG: TssQ family T6SS-associated lipoprotein [Casimicrobiaceae bacterium]